MRHARPELDPGRPATVQQPLDEGPRRAQVLHPPAPPRPVRRAGSANAATPGRQQSPATCSRVADEHLGPVAEVGLPRRRPSRDRAPRPPPPARRQQGQRVGADAAPQIDHPAYARRRRTGPRGGRRPPAALACSSPSRVNSIVSASATELGPGRPAQPDLGQRGGGHAPAVNRDRSAVAARQALRVLLGRAAARRVGVRPKGSADRRVASQADRATTGSGESAPMSSAEGGLPAVHHRGAEGGDHGAVVGAERGTWGAQPDARRRPPARPAARAVGGWPRPHRRSADPSPR